MTNPLFLEMRYNIKKNLLSSFLLLVFFAGSCKKEPVESNEYFSNDCSLSSGRQPGKEQFTQRNTRRNESVHDNTRNHCDVDHRCSTEKNQQKKPRGNSDTAPAPTLSRENQYDRTRAFSDIKDEKEWSQLKFGGKLLIMRSSKNGPNRTPVVHYFEGIKAQDYRQSDHAENLNDHNHGK